VTLLRLLLIVVLGLMMNAARSFIPLGETVPAATTLAIGYLLLTAFLAGSVAKAIGLPRLTGYLSTGVIAGPEVLGLVSAEMTDNLRIVTGVAISLIALTAGTELHFRSMRPLLRGIVGITVVGVVGTMIVLVITAYLLRDLLPFMAGLGLTGQLAVAGMLGVTIVAQSPAVVVALRDETDADGPLTQTVLGVVILADLLVIIMFAGMSAVAQEMLGDGGDVAATARTLAWEIFGSLGAGLVVGIGVWAYFKKVGRSGALFVVALSFVIAEVGNRLHLDPLIVSLAAGVFLRNFTEVGDLLHREIESASLPIYVAFFAVAGAGIHIHALAAVGIPAAIFVVIRATGLYLGTRVGSTLTGAPDVVRRYAGFGLMPQAGLALALALLFQRAFPQLGAEAAALVFGIVGINELIAPVLLRAALLRSGEAGRRGHGEGGEAVAPSVVGPAVTSPAATEPGPSEPAPP
jgi:Kef-type K+ transport system membrane component KefB